MEKPRSASSRRGKRAKKKGASTARKINFSAIPELSIAQLKSMRRVGRPPLGEAARQLIAIRIDPGVLRKLQERAKGIGIGYQTLINNVLGKYIKKP